MDERLLLHRGCCGRRYHLDVNAGDVLKLSELHEEFLDRARRPMSFDRLPVSPTSPQAPIVPTDRWRKVDQALVRVFEFQETSQRNDFVRQLLDYEASVGHHAVMKIDERKVELTLQTKDVQQVTELDKEYSSYASELFKDVVYSTRHERRR